MTTKPQSNPQVYRSFDQPDQQETFPNGTLDLISLGGDQQVGRIKFESGWRYSDSTHTDGEHVGIITRGAMHIRDDNGLEHTIKENSVVRLRPGVDAWVDDLCEMIDYTNPREFAGSSA